MDSLPGNIISFLFRPVAEVLLSWREVEKF
jgi:hypothetical protein